MHKIPETLPELFDYIEQHSDAIYVRFKLHGNYGNHPLSALPAADALHWVFEFIKKKEFKMSEREVTTLEPARPSLEAIQKLSKDLKEAAKTLGVREARYFVDTYYILQDYRIAAANQQRALTTDQEPTLHIEWLNTQMETLENQIRTLLDKWSGAQPMGIWARGVVGVGPVISAGLLANIDITRAPTAGHIWRFAGLDPTSKWAKGEKRPWNASLKRLCWLIGESFVKVSGNARDRYGKLYLQRKEYESKKNEALDYADQAKATLARIKDRKNKVFIALLESGKLPPAALHARSKRWAVKLFLAHWHAEAYRMHYGTEPPKPYPIAILGHAHVIEP
jgi:hypothetical protein